MRKAFVFAVIAACSLASPAMAADTVTFNGAPNDGFLYGTGNGYAPANALVSTWGAGPWTPGGELALRFHQTFQPAPASDANGVYSFALGTTPISFDWGVDGSFYNALITLTNIGTGQSVSYDPFAVGNDNFVTANDTDLAQNSFRLNWAGIGFDPTLNDTYSATLTSGGHSLTAFAQLGSGAPAVPEPATWALMLVGFGGIGFQMRRKRPRTLAQIA